MVDFCGQILGMSVQKTAIAQCLRVVIMFIMLYKVVLTF